MDPAETDKLRQALSMQGTRVGQHEQVIHEIMETLQKLSSGVTQLSSRLDQVVTRIPSLAPTGDPLVSAAAAAAPSAPLPSPVREPHIPTPDRYSGELGACSQFLHQCSLVFDQQSVTYAADKSKIAFIMSLLSGRASSWALAISTRDSAVTNSYLAFVSEMRKVFDHPVQGKEAGNRLLSLRQGSASVSHYAIDFRILAAESNWDEAALQSVFLKGLADSVKDELAARDETQSLDDLISLAIRLDNRLRERRRERLGRQGNPLPSLLNSPSPAEFLQPSPATVPAAAPGPRFSSTPSREEPMQLGRMKLSLAERERRVRNRLCIYCGQPGHFLATCPQLPKGQAHQPPEGRW